MTPPGWHRTDLPFGVGVALALGYVAILVGLVVAGPPANELSVARSSSGRSVVATVPVGGPAWSVGVRSGMEVIGAEPPGADPAGDWESLVVTDGTVQVALPRAPSGPGAVVAFAVIGALVLGLASVAWLPNVAGLLVLLSLSLSTLVVVPLFGPPLNVALLVPAPAAAALYASDRRRSLHRAVPAIAGIAVVAVLGAWAVAYVARIDDWHLPPSLALLTVVALGMLGALGAMRDALQRARARRAATGGAASLAALLADELVPGRSSTRLSAIERERGRLATELHADVLPDLSAVIREIEAGAPLAEAAAHLRAISVELRDLVSERRLAVLQEAGLVRALEYLAERVEAQTGVTVDLDVSGASSDDPRSRPPRDVELALYRIAQQAIDNALLHARAAVIRIRVDGDPIHVDLEVADDGTGIAPAAEDRALRAGHLGISDMRQRAASIGAAFGIRPAPDGGTLVEVRWPA